MTRVKLQKALVERMEGALTAAGPVDAPEDEQAVVFEEASRVSVSFLRHDHLTLWAVAGVRIGGVREINISLGWLGPEGPPAHCLSALRHIAVGSGRLGKSLQVALGLQFQLSL